jgi:uncharacterized protein YbbC (DUF1343 family)
MIARLLPALIAGFALSLLHVRPIAAADPPARPLVRLGIDVLADRDFAPLKGKRVGVVVNPASVDASLRPTVDILLAAGKDKVNLVALVGPEHGVWGDEYAGDKIDDRTDPRTGLPAFSLYGKTRKPTPEMLADVDVLVFDLQDIGSRSYTYISTMKVCLEACAEQGKELVVLDRPNPLGGRRVEGGLVGEGFRSFVSELNVPYLHGMTMGELAQWVKAAHAPSFDKLTVIPMTGWTRDMTWDDTGLAWVPTSPHIPTSASAAAYAATGILGELKLICNGVGYTQPFELVGGPDVDGERLAEAMNRRFGGADSGLYFRPVPFKPFYAQFSGQKCQGVQVHIDPARAPTLLEVNFRLLEAMEAPAILAQTQRRHSMFDKVSGTDRIRKALAERADLDPIFAEWRAAAGKFAKEREAYLIYR